MKPRLIIYSVITSLLVFALIFGEHITFTTISEENLGAPYTKQVEGSITLNSTDGLGTDFYQIEEKYLLKEELGKNSRIRAFFSSSEWEIYSFICTTKDPTLNLTVSNLFSNYIDYYQSVGLTKQGSLDYDVETTNTYYIVFQLSGFALQANLPFDERPIWYSYTTIVDFAINYTIQDTYELQTIRAPLQSSYTPLLLGGILVIALVDMGNFESIKNEISIRFNQIQATRMASEVDNRQLSPTNSYSAPQRRKSEDQNLSNQKLCTQCFRKVGDSEIFCRNCGNQLIR